MGNFEWWILNFDWESHWLAISGGDFQTNIQNIKFNITNRV
jgi:hypothetical protein